MSHVFTKKGSDSLEPVIGSSSSSYGSRSGSRNNKGLEKKKQNTKIGHDDELFYLYCETLAIEPKEYVCLKISNQPEKFIDKYDYLIITNTARWFSNGAQTLHSHSKTDPSLVNKNTIIDANTITGIQSIYTLKKIEEAFEKQASIENTSDPVETETNEPNQYPYSDQE